MQVDKHCDMEHINEIRIKMMEYLESISGPIDTKGVEIIGQIKSVSTLIENMMAQKTHEVDLSRSRWAILLFLQADELVGNKNGVTPTSLSKIQHVSKNTISALVKGLEKQKLISRYLDDNDHRIFRIRITDKGRELMNQQASVRINMLNQLVLNFSAEECTLLIGLLGKLQNSAEIILQESLQESSGG